MEFANKLSVFLPGIIIGVILFQTIIVAPTVFKSLGAELASPFLRAIFPKLFLNVAVLSLIGVVLSVIGDRLSLQILFFVSFLLMSISYLIVPATNKARDEGRDKSFKYLHLLSVILTLSTLVLCLIILVAT